MQQRGPARRLGPPGEYLSTDARESAPVLDNTATLDEVLRRQYHIMAGMAELPREQAPAYDDDEMVWVEKVTADKPTIHRVRPPTPEKKNFWIMTACERRLNFSSKHALMPYKHAERFGVLCDRC